MTVPCGQRCLIRPLRSHEPSPTLGQTGLPAYAAAFAAFPVGAIVCTPDGRFIDVNAEFARIVGRDRDALVGTNWRDLTHPEDAPACDRVIEEAVAGRVGPATLEKRYLRPDGTAVWCRISLAVLAGDAPTDFRVVAHVHDVSDRLAGERALRDAQARLAAAFEGAPIGVAVVAPDCSYLEVNPVLCELLGRTREELLRLTWRDVTHPDDLPADDVVVERIRRERTVGFDIEKRYLRPDGTTVWVRLNSSVIRDERGDEVAAIVHVEDISARLETEAFMRDVEERLEVGFRNAPLGMTIADASGQLTDVNDAFCAMVGRSRQSLVGTTWQELIHPDDRAAAEGRMRSLAAQGGTYSATKRFMHADGSAVWTEISVSLVDASDRRGGYAICQAQDISARRAAEEALQVAEARFRATFERAPIGMAMLTLEGGYMAVNEALCEMVGYTEQELLAISWQELTPAEDLPAELEKRERRILFETHDEYRWQKRYRRKDGTLIWVDISSYRVRGADGEPLHIFSQYQDISERRRALEALRESEQRFTTMFESAPIGMALSTLDGVLVAVNPALAEMSGYSVDNLVGAPTTSFVHPEDAGREANLRRELACGATDTNVFERRLVRQGGDIVPVEINAALIRGEDGTPLYVLEQVTDLGTRRRLERQIQQASKLEAIGRLAGGVAHDFNNMLLVVRGYTHLLLQRLGEDDPARAEAVEIDLAAERAARLVGQLLAFGRRQVLQPRVLDLNEVVRQTDALLRRLVGDEIAVELALSADIAPVRADPSQIEQVIVNLAINGRDAIVGRGTLRFETVEVALDKDDAGELGVEPGRYGRLVVRDDGSGMSREVLARAFEPFFTTKAEGIGTGLGLAAVHGIVTQSGGGLSVESAPGAGTAVSVFLPLAVTSVEAPRAPRQLTPGLPRRDVEILVVEDDLESRLLITRVLGAAGFRVTAFAIPADALEWLAAEERPVALLISDIVMPAMRGPELAREVMTQRAGIGVLLISGYADDAVADDLAASGIHFLAKPFTPADLLSAVDGAATRFEVAL